MDRLIEITKKYNDKYSEIVNDMEYIRKKCEYNLMNIVKEAQTSEEGIDIQELDIKVDYDGYEKLKVYAIRVIKPFDDSIDDYIDDYIELKILNRKGNGYEWVSLYDFYSNTGIDIFVDFMEKL